MKFVIGLLICIGVLVFGEITSPSKSLENTLNAIKDQMPCGFPNIGIPPLAPFEMKYAEHQEKFGIIKINSVIENLVLSGLNNYNVSDASMNILTLKSGFIVKFNEIKILGRLTLHTWIIEFLKLKTSGNLDIVLKNLEVSIKTRFGMVDSVMKIMEFTPHVTLEGLELKSTGFLIEFLMKIFNSIAEKMILSTFNNNSKFVDAAISNIVLPYANDYLKNMTVMELLDILTGPKEQIICIPKAP